MRHVDNRNMAVENIGKIADEVLDTICWIDSSGKSIKINKMPSDKIRRILSFLSSSRNSNKKWIYILEAERKRRSSSMHY